MILPLTGAIGIAAYWAYMPSSQIYGPTISYGPQTERAVALTFDDGPSDPWTLRIADVLERYGVKGTFFVVGENADAHPEVVRALVDRGHVVGNHSYHHRKRDAILEPRYQEVAEAERSIARASGLCPAFFRPPNSFRTPWQLGAVARAGLRVVTWDVQPSDWRSSATTIAERVVSSARPGSIVLLHDGYDTRGHPDRSATVEALPKIIDGLRAKGYRLVGLDELLGIPGYLSKCSEEKSA